MTHISADELKTHTESIVKSISGHGGPIIISIGEKDVAALVSMEDYALFQEWEDRMDLEAFRQAKAEVAREGTIPWESMTGTNRPGFSPRDEKSEIAEQL